MVFLEIEAEILTHKHFEFSQSKLAFISDIQKAPGYLNFFEKHGTQFKMRITWENYKSLSNFLKTEQYKFFHGAIITLGNSYHVNIIDD